MPVPRRENRTEASGWTALERRIVSCERCPRLRRHCAEIARTRRRAYRDQEYWGRPVPGFGDSGANLLVLGLAPAAHGANRTGRMFTGDDSGTWLFRALRQAGLADRAESVSRGDGLTLAGAFVTAACRCAPPGNRPTAEELKRCAPFLDAELDLLSGIRAILALGRVAWDAALRRSAAESGSEMPRPRPRFAHGAEVRLRFHRRRPPLWLVGSYHPSRQNTQTGRLTRRMLDEVVQNAARRANETIRTRNRSPVCKEDP